MSVTSWSVGTQAQSEPGPVPRCVTPGILPFAHRPSLRLFKIAPGDFVAPNSKHRLWVTPAKRGKGSQYVTADPDDEKTPAQRHVAMRWAQSLKRVFNIDVDTCRACGAAAKVAVPAHPAPTAFVRPCTSSPALRIPWSSGRY